MVKMSTTTAAPAQTSSPSTVKPAAPPASAGKMPPAKTTKADPKQAVKPVVEDKAKPTLPVRDAAADLDERILSEQKPAKPAAETKDMDKGTENEKAAANVAAAPDKLQEGKETKEAKEAKDVTFSWSACDADKVEIIGSFTQWKGKAPMSKDGGQWTLVKKLPPGTHQYKFIVDGNWWYDITLPTAADAEGNVNNVITV